MRFVCFYGDRVGGGGALFRRCSRWFDEPAKLPSTPKCRVHGTRYTPRNVVGYVRMSLPFPLPRPKTPVFRFFCFPRRHLLLRSRARECASALTSLAPCPGWHVQAQARSFTFFRTSFYSCAAAIATASPLERANLAASGSSSVG